jgi:hypothetical protein
MAGPSENAPDQVPEPNYLPWAELDYIFAPMAARLHLHSCLFPLPYFALLFVSEAPLVAVWSAENEVAVWHRSAIRAVTMDIYPLSPNSPSTRSV